VGSHFVVFGSVQDIFMAGGGAPLIYANRAYGVPQRFHPRSAANAAPAPAGGALTLGCFQIFAPYIVPALLARMTKLHPALALTLLEADQTRLVASLRRGEIDVALLYDFDLGEGIEVERLADLMPYVLLPDGHPLSEHSAVSLEALAAEPLVLLDVEPSRDYFLSLFRDRGIEPHIGLSSGSLEMVRGLVGHGLGYSLLTTKPANNMSYDGRALVTRPLSASVKNSRLVLASVAGRSLSPIVHEFAGHCRAFFGVSHAHPAT
jgi:DNA-binding transcriptional LysR family regulator